jgi:hypothetical protein
MKRAKQPRRFVVCVKNKGYPAWLEVRKVYRALPDRDAEQHGLLRIVDEDGEDYLYPERYFVPVQLSLQSARAIAGAT